MFSSVVNVISVVFHKERDLQNNAHDIKKETIVMDPMCMDERILCCTHSVTGIFMGSNNTVWQHISSICSFIPCSKNIGNYKYFNEISRRHFEGFILSLKSN